MVLLPLSSRRRSNKSVQYMSVMITENDANRIYLPCSAAGSSDALGSSKSSSATLASSRTTERMKVRDLGAQAPLISMSGTIREPFPVMSDNLHC